MTSLTETLAGLVRINSVNPVYGDGGSEANLAPLVERFFAGRGIGLFAKRCFLAAGMSSPACRV